MFEELTDLTADVAEVSFELGFLLSQYLLIPSRFVMDVGLACLR